MRYYGMSEDQALNTRMDKAEYLQRKVADEQDLELLGLVMAFHHPKTVLEKLAKKKEPKKKDPGRLAEGFAKVARARPGDKALNEAKAQQILLQAKAMQLLKKVRKK